MQGNEKKRVLIVEDMKNWQELLRDLLKKDYTVTVCDNLDGAWEIIKQQDPPFHVAILDIRLEDRDADNQDGLALAELMNAIKECTKIIILTGYPTPETKKKAFTECSVFDYLEKVPDNGEGVFDPDAFLLTVYKAAQEASKLHSEHILR